MNFHRIWMMVKLNSHLTATARGAWIKKEKVFAECGDHVRYQIHSIPLCPELIKIGSNVNISTGASMIVHDATHLVYNCLPDKKEKLREYANPIKIGDNVFVGAKVCIMGGVEVGSNVIIAAGAVVTKDLAPGGVYGGVPARKIGDVEQFWKKRESGTFPTINSNSHLTEEEIKAAWAYFDQNHA